MELLDAKDFYSDFSYPNGILKIIELNLVDFDLWYLMQQEQAILRIKGLKERYPGRKLIPFARRDDSDDIACFEVGKKIGYKLSMTFQVKDMNKEKSMLVSGIGLEMQ